MLLLMPIISHLSVCDFKMKANIKDIKFKKGVEIAIKSKETSSKLAI